jgi:low affinity Fe/Cu permease
MRNRRRLKVSEVFERLSEAVTKWTGGTGAFGIAVAVVVVWVAVGPIFHYSDTWQLVINTGTTIITFLMVFLIQRSQNKDALAIHLKLNELVAAMKGASNRLIEAEGLSEKELTALRRHYQELAALAAREADLTKSHSVEEAGKRHTAKKRGQAS